MLTNFIEFYRLSLLFRVSYFTVWYSSVQKIFQGFLTAYTYNIDQVPINRVRLYGRPHHFPVTPSHLLIPQQSPWVVEVQSGRAEEEEKQTEASKRQDKTLECVMASQRELVLTRKEAKMSNGKF